MNAHELQEWLHRADRSAAKPAHPPLDANGLQQLIARRRRKRRGMAMAAAAGMVLAAAVLRSPSREADMATPTTEKVAVAIDDALPARDQDPDELHDQVEALRHEINRRKAMVAALQEAKERDRLEEQLADLNASAPPSAELLSLRLEQVRNESAAISLFYADLLADAFGEQELAATEYKTIARRFPQTVWSAAAERSLSKREL